MKPACWRNDHQRSVSDRFSAGSQLLGVAVPSNRPAIQWLRVVGPAFIEGVHGELTTPIESRSIRNFDLETSQLSANPVRTNPLARRMESRGVAKEARQG